MLGSCGRIRATTLALVLAAGSAGGQQVDDPDWPCIQRKVPTLSLGQMWDGPVPPEGWRPDGATQELARNLAPRRVPLDRVEAAATEFAEGLPGEERGTGLAELLAAVLRQINAERGQVIAGIARYAHNQAGFSGEIDAMQQELVRLRDVPDDGKVWDRIEELEDRLAWEARIFKERAQSLTYVCETPVLLEQRAFAIARTLAALI
jgi:hypothetical protein